MRNPSAPRWALHEAGIARMGANPKNPSSTNSAGHDVKESFRYGRFRLHFNPCQNPTLTIMSLAVRSCDYLMSELEAQFTLGSPQPKILSVRHTRRLDSAGEPFLTATLNLF